MGGGCQAAAGLYRGCHAPIGSAREPPPRLAERKSLKESRWHLAAEDCPSSFTCCARSELEEEVSQPDQLPRAQPGAYGKFSGDPNDILGVDDIAAIFGRTKKWVYETFTAQCPRTA